MLTAVIIAIWTALLGGAISNSTIFGQIRGGTADWLIVTEAVSGTDAYATASDLALEHLDWRDAGPDAPHPRPPSAITILLPLILVPPDQIVVALMILSSCGLVYWVQSCVKWMRAGVEYEFLAIPFAITLPILQGVVWGTHMPLVAAALGASIAYSVEERKADLQGIFVGIASALKLFPLAVSFAEKKGRLRNVSVSIASLLVLTALGLSLPGVDADGALDALLHAPESFGDNPLNLSIGHHLGGSIPMTAAVVVAGIAAITLIATRADPWLAKSASLILAVVASPLAWPEYLVLAFPAFLALVLSGTGTRVLALVGWGVMVWSIDGTTLLLISLGILLSLALPQVRERVTTAREALTRPPQPS